MPTENPPITTLQVSPLDIGGGAEKVAMDLHHSFRKRGLHAWLAVCEQRTHEPGVVTIPCHDRLSPWTRNVAAVADRLSERRGTKKGPLWVADRGLRVAADPAHITRIQRGLEGFDHPSTYSIPELIPERPDVLHLHNLHGEYFDIRALPTLSSAVPTVVTMHDAWLLTGHCAYPMKCDRWKIGCGDCPDLTSTCPSGGIRARRISA